MSKRLLIAVALGALGAVLAAGAVSAQGGKGILGLGEGKVTIDLPNSADLPIVGELICKNGSGELVDINDPRCREPQPEAPAPGGGGSGPGGPSDGGSGGGGGKGKRKPPANAPDPDAVFDSGESGGKTSKPKPKSKDNGREKDAPPKVRRPDGAPTNSNPSLSVATFGPAPIGVPNFIIDRFTIPPFLLQIYQACGTQYGIPWQILASINRIETAFGTNLNVSSAGAVGWMQFMPATWKAYGVDANGDDRKDPYNPWDAICAAARYLKASGYATDVRGAIFAYNHADWYVDEVLLYARQYGKLPHTLVDSLTQLTEGAHFPIAAKARYADDISEREAARRATPRSGNRRTVADVVTDSPTRRGINIFAKEGAPVVAVNDGVIKRIGKNKRLGRFIVLKDSAGNRFTYAGMGEVADAIPVPKKRDLRPRDFELVTPGKGRKAARPGPSGGATQVEPADTEDARERLFALPERKANRQRATLTGQLNELLGDAIPGYETFKAYFSGVLRFDPKRMEAQPLRKGSRVVGGTVLGEVGTPAQGVASHLHFAIKPVGRGARKIDPKPILDGWKLLEATAIYRAAGKSPFGDRVNVSQILLASKAALQRRVLRDQRIEIYSCGREDIRTGQIDRRVLASLAFLAERGISPTVTSLRCGRASSFTKSGSISHHATGHAVDIARLNGIPVLGNQGRGSITEAAVLELLKLQGSMLPAQIITLMEMGGPTFAMGDHHDHIHVGFTPTYGPGERRAARYERSMLNPNQWDKLIDRISKLDQPEVPTEPSRWALPAKKKGARRASQAHVGE